MLCAATKWSAGVALVCAAWMSLVGCDSTPAQTVRPTAEAAPILRGASGDEPGLAHPVIVYVDARSKLDDLHAPELEKLHADFVREALIVVSLGERPTAGYWVRITGVRRLGHALIVRATVNRPGPKDASAQVVTHPYAAVVIPTQSGPIEVNVESTSVEGEATAGHEPF